MFGLINKKKMIKDLQKMKEKVNKSYENSIEVGKEDKNRDSFQYNQGECNVLNYLIDVYLN